MIYLFDPGQEVVNCFLRCLITSPVEWRLSFIINRIHIKTTTIKVLQRKCFIGLCCNMNRSQPQFISHMQLSSIFIKKANNCRLSQKTSKMNGEKSIIIFCYLINPILNICFRIPFMKFSVICILIIYSHFVLFYHYFNISTTVLFYDSF